MLNEVDNAALVLESDLLLFAWALIFKDDFKALIKEGHGLETLHDSAGHKLHTLGGKNRGVWIEGHRSAGLAATRWRLACRREFLLHLAAVGKFHGVALAATVDFKLHLGGQCVHHADTHAVQAAGHLVALAAELSTGVKHSENYFGCALSLMWAGGVRVDWNASAVVVYSTAAIGKKCDADAITESSHGFVNRVVNNFPNEVVKTSEAS